MTGYNSIRLLKGQAYLSNNEYKKFSKGDTIWGADANAEVLKCWEAKEEEAARKELEQYRCEYHCYEAGMTYDITEYALEFFNSDEDGEFLNGSDYDLAE